MKKSNLTFIFKHFYLYTLLLILVILSLHMPLVYILLLIYLYLVRRLLNWIFASLVIGSYIFLFVSFLPKAQPINSLVTIIEVDSMDKYFRYTIHNGQNKYHYSSRIAYSIGDQLFIQGQIEVYRRATIPGGFSSYHYYLGKDIKGILRGHASLKDSPLNIDFISQINNPILKLFKDETLIYSNWMSHLFKLSSLHLTFMTIYLMKFLYYLDVADLHKYLIVSILMMLLYFVGYSILILRMCIKYFISYLNRKFILSIDAFNIECVTCILILLLKPYVVYNYSFIVVYTIYFFMQLKTSSTKGYNFIIIPILIAPFLLAWHKEVNLLALLVIPIFASVLRYIFVPVIVASSIFSNMNLLPILTNVIQSIETFLSRYAIKIYMPNIEGIMWVLYFLVIVIIVASSSKKVFIKRLSIYTTMMFILFLSTFKPIDDQVVFLDVGQGDSAVIFNNNHIIVVDAFQSVTSYLKYMNVHTIDYLILTHPDIDHIKEADDLIHTFNVKHIIISQYGSYNLKGRNIIKVGANNLFKDDLIGLNILGPLVDLNDSNENSVVFQIDVNNYRYLFTGDIGIRAESTYIKQYDNELQSDVLKVPHHGSTTSSSSEFIIMVRPGIVIVSVAQRNVYNLPNEVVLQRYRDFGVHLHLTSISGSLVIKESQMRNFPP